MSKFFRIIKSTLLDKSAYEHKTLVVEGISEKTHFVGNTTTLYVLHTTTDCEFKNFESFGDALQYKKLLPNDGNDYTIV